MLGGKIKRKVSERIRLAIYICVCIAISASSLLSQPPKAGGFDLKCFDIFNTHASDNVQENESSNSEDCTEESRITASEFTGTSFQFKPLLSALVKKIVTDEDDFTSHILEPECRPPAVHV